MTSINIFKLSIHTLTILILMSNQTQANIGRILDNTVVATKNTAEIAATQTKRKARDFFKTHSVSNAHFLSIMDRGAFIEDAMGKKLLIAKLNTVGVLTLSPNSFNILKNIDIILPEDDLLNLKPLLDQGLGVQSKSVKVIRSDGSIGRLLPKKIKGISVQLFEKYPGVFLQVASSEMEDLTWALEQVFQPSNVRIVSLLHETDVDIQIKIDSIFGGYHLPAGELDSEAIVNLVKSQNQKTIFVIGHVENDKFVVRDPAGSAIQNIPIADLENAAEESDSSIFLLGCSTGLCNSASGFIESVNAFNVTKGLKFAVKQSSNGKVLSELASISGDFVVRPQLISPTRISLIANYKELKKINLESKMGVWTVRGVGLLSSSRSKELLARIIPYVPSNIQYFYILGCILLMFSLRSLLREWKEIRSPAPRFRHRPVTCIAVYIIRFTVFIVFVPFVATIAFIVDVASNYSTFFSRSPDNNINFLMKLPLIFVEECFITDLIHDRNEDISDG